MSYIEDQLTPKEKIVFKGKIHLIVFWLPIVLTLVGFLLHLSFFWWIIILVVWMYSLVEYLCTEIALTDKRVIAKQGFLSVRSAEMRYSAVEGVRVNISLLGYLLCYGTLVICGKGGKNIGIPYLVSPKHFKKEMYVVMENETSNK